MVSNHDDQFDDVSFSDDGLEQYDDMPEESFGDDDWDSLDDQAELSADARSMPSAPARKKSGLFNIVLLGGGVLAGLAVLYFQFGGSSTPQTAPSPAPQQAQQQTQQQTTQHVETANAAPAQAAPSMPTPPQPAPTTPHPAGGFLSDPDALVALERDVAISYHDTEAEVVETVEDDFAPRPPLVDNAATLPMPTSISPVTEVVAPAPAAQLPRVEDIAPPSPAPSAALPATPQATGHDAVQPAPSVTADQKVLEKLDAVLARLDTLEQDVQALQERPAPSSASSDARMKELGDSIAALEKKIAATPARSVPATPARAAPNDDVAVPAQKPQILGGQNDSQPAARAPSAARPAQKAPQWVLKGAQPGRAMVAEVGQAGMRDIAVGDDLAGIGRITDILYENGRWVVKGTQGQIRQ